MKQDRVTVESWPMKSSDDTASCPKIYLFTYKFADAYKVIQWLCSSMGFHDKESPQQRLGLNKMFVSTF